MSALTAEFNIDVAALIATSSATTSFTNTGTTTPTSVLSGLFKKITTWLADTANGIERIVARVFKGERAEVNELCVGTTCITESQFAAVFGAGASPNPPTSVPSSPSEIRELAPTTTPAELPNSEQPDNESSTTTPPAAIDTDPPATPAELPSSPPVASNDNDPPASADTDDVPSVAANDNQETESLTGTE